ncbi:SH2B3 protein, partial [Atractosteus spatula]|nr:SH2B3 protein [Atractosteus spatula]
MNGNTIQQGTTSPSVAQPRGWKEFCELHAIATAKELAQQYRRFASERGQHDVVAADSFSKQFAELFQQYFRHEVGGEAPAMTGRYRIASFSGAQDYREAQRHLAEGPQAFLAVLAPKVEPLVAPREQERGVRRAPADTNCPARALPRSRSSEELSASAPPAPAPAGPGVTHFSMSQIRHSVRGLFRQQRASRRGRPRESCKEGHLKYLMVDDTSLDTLPNWQRCKLMVRKTEGTDEEYLLELFDPPKSCSPRRDRPIGRKVPLQVRGSRCLLDGLERACPGRLAPGPHSAVELRLLCAVARTTAGSSPKLRAPCSAITEIRRCNRLEMPDNMNTFVLKVNHFPGSLIFETDNDQQVSSWTTEIKECINTGDASTTSENLLVSRISLIMASVTEQSQHSSCCAPVSCFLFPAALPHSAARPCQCPGLPQPAEFQAGGVFLAGQQETAALQCRRSGCCSLFSRCIQRDPPIPPALESNLSDSADMELLTSPLSDLFPSARRGSSESMGQGATHFAVGEQIYQKTDHFLSSYPWFHGPISRVKAAHLVQMAGTRGHGVFLVRQSETRRGDYVLTFNFQGKAKHLRLSVTDRGQCRVQHLRFPSVVEMLNHFKRYPIPLECGAACDVKLSSYVVASSSSQGLSVPSTMVLVPFTLHRWSSEPSLAHVTVARCPRVHTLDSLHQPVPAPAPQLFQRMAPPEEVASQSLQRSESVGTQPQRHSLQRDPDYELEPTNRGHKRAIDNQYMLL